MKNVLLTGALVSVFFVLIFLGKIIINLDKPLGSGGDVVFNYFILDNDFKKLLSFDLANLFHTRMFYPYKDTLAFGNTHLGISLLGLPIFLITKDVIFSANTIIVISFFLTFLSTYYFIYFLTSSIKGSIIGALIYTYNPFVFAHTPFHFELFALFWIPLIFLSLENLIKKITIRWCALLALFCIGQLTTSFYYAFFLAATVPVYLALRIYLKKIPLSHFLNIKLFITPVILFIFSFFYLTPFIRLKSSYNWDELRELIVLLSAKPLDFFFTTPTNYLYGWMVQNPFFSHLRGSYTTTHYTEHSLFPGFTAYFLLIVALFLVFKKVVPFMTILVLSILLSFGPDSFLYSLLYKSISFVQTIRAPTRFWVMGLFALATIASFAWIKLENMILISLKKTLFITLLILISLEYLTFIADPQPVEGKIINFYKWLNQRDDVKVILELPAANTLYDQPQLFRAFIDDTEYLFYGIYHNKYLVNGYNSFIPPDYPKLTNQLAINFPTHQKLDSLKRLGVDVIIIHPLNYPQKQEGINMIKKLQTLGLRQIYTNDMISAFLLR